jgi:glycosyltransferase involved in cell wall biosynthesis
MNICFLSETSAWGGAEVHTARLAEVLAERGHEVRIVALGHGVFDEIGRASGRAFTVQRVPLAKPVKQLSLAECAALVRELPEGTAVLVRFGLDVGSLRLDRAARRRFSRYLVVEHSAAILAPRTSRRHLWGLLPGLGLWRLQHRLLWYVRSVAPDLVVCVSDVARGRMVRDFRVPARKVVTVHSGIDCARFRPDAERRAAARREWGFADDALVFGAVGRLHADKGLDLAVEGLDRLAARYPDRDLRLVLVGDGPEKESLMRAARDAGLAGRVVFAGFSARPWEAYAGLDVFLLPSRDEALPLALLEAMACGCCPIAMGVGGVSEVIAGPTTGWMITPGDGAAFVEAMEAAVRMGADARTAMSRAARERVAADFDAGRQYAALADLVEQGNGAQRSETLARRASEGRGSSLARQANGKVCK